MATQTAVSTWDKLTAIGTLASAVVATVAVIAALCISARDRSAANAALRASAAAARRDHLLDLLLRVQAQIMVAGADPITANRLPATMLLRGMLQALPAEILEGLPATRITYVTGRAGPTFLRDMQVLHKVHQGAQAKDFQNPEYCAGEVGEAIGRVRDA